jgi:hypothetical protein
MDIMAILMAMDTIITIMDITIVIGMITTTGDETAHWAIWTSISASSLQKKGVRTTPTKSEDYDISELDDFRLKASKFTSF